MIKTVLPMLALLCTTDLSATPLNLNVLIRKICEQEALEGEATISSKKIPIYFLHCPLANKTLIEKLSMRLIEAKTSLANYQVGPNQFILEPLVKTKEGLANLRIATLMAVEPTKTLIIDSLALPLFEALVAQKEAQYSGEHLQKIAQSVHPILEGTYRFGKGEFYQFEGRVNLPKEQVQAALDEQLGKLKFQPFQKNSSTETTEQNEQIFVRGSERLLTIELLKEDPPPMTRVRIYETRSNQ